MSLSTEVTVLTPTGHLDSRVALRFERDALECLRGGCRLVIVDCAGVVVLAGAGLRVLVMLARSLEAAGGRLVLCGVERQIRSVLQVAGLSAQFTIVASVQEAMTEMAALASAAPSSALAARVAALTGAGVSPLPATAPTPELRALAARVAAMLGIPS